MAVASPAGHTLGPSECLAVGVAQTHSLCLRLVALGHGGADAGVPAVVADGDEDLPSWVVQATVRDPRSNGLPSTVTVASPPVFEPLSDEHAPKAPMRPRALMPATTVVVMVFRMTCSCGSD